MNQDSEASSSSQPPPESIKAKLVADLLKECRQLSELVDSARNVNTLTFFSRLIVTAFEAIETISNETKTSEVNGIEACEYCFEKACDASKKISTMFLNAILTSSSTKNTSGGGSKKVSMWKKQCNKNIEKIQSLIKNAFLMDSSTCLDAFWLYGIFHEGVCAIFVFLHKILTMKESLDDENFKHIAEKNFENFEMIYRNLVSGMLDIVRKGKTDLLEESNLKNSEEEDTLKKLQEETTVTQKNTQEVDTGQKNIEEEETRKKLQEVETHNKLQEEEALIKKLNLENSSSSDDKEDALKKSEEDGIVERFQKETIATQKNIENVEAGQKNIEEEEAQKKLQEAETQKKLQEEEASKKLGKEKNSVEGDEVMEFLFGDMTFKMKNVVLERVFK